MEDWRHSVKLWDLLEWFGYKFWAASDGEQDLLQQEQASFYPGSPERMPVNCHCIKGKCCGDYLLRILSWTCESHPWSMNPSCRALPGTLCHLLSRCPWLTLPWSVAGETKNNVGCLLACLLASLQPLRSQNWTPPTLSACGGPLNKQWLTCSALPPTYSGNQEKKEKIMRFGILWFSLPPPWHLRVSDICW